MSSTAAAPAAPARRPVVYGPILPSETMPLSTIGAKAVVAVTGILLLGFVIVHMIGNLLVFAGPDALNSYAKALKDTGPLLWVGRIGLLIAFILHVSLAWMLAYRRRSARPVGYAYERVIQASWASRYMFTTGLVLLAFILFHLAHYTFAVVHGAYDPVTGRVENYLELRDPLGRHDVYRMVIAGFSNPIISVSYIIAMVFLALHLYHGATSIFQTLGLNHRRYNPIFKWVGPVLAVVIGVGNISMPLAVWAGWVR